ncbi:MAG: chromosomal replication initiation protein [Chlamydiales bacterium]|jgi:chromosomal replication initiator protein|nr:chromosomal replication initiation protein [Chlamydiales bacterium]
MSTSSTCDSWTQFLEYAKKRCSASAFENWLAPIQLVSTSLDEVKLEVPNIFVKEYLLENYKVDLCAFLPVKSPGEPAVSFQISEQNTKAKPALNYSTNTPHVPTSVVDNSSEAGFFGDPKLNRFYKFETFIEGPSNQFVKSAALGVANRPGRSYNPLFIHGGVGLGKTHLLHAIGHYVKDNHKKLRVQCITTEAFINDLVYSLQNKSVDKMKRFYRTLDVLLIDDIQFLQNRLNFEEEFCNTIEALINQGKQIVITSDKPPRQLKLSERMIGRMEWGLVALLGIPDLETRVAILQNKAANKGLKLPHNVAFFIAEHIYSNVRQLEGAINKLSAHSRLFNLDITERLAEETLKEMMQIAPREKVTVESILKSVAAVFQVRVADLKGESRTKQIALPRQVAMYLAKKMLDENLIVGSTLNEIGDSLGGRSHSTILHGYKTIVDLLEKDEILGRKIEMAQRGIDSN